MATRDTNALRLEELTVDEDLGEAPEEVGPEPPDDADTALLQLGLPLRASASGRYTPVPSPGRVVPLLRNEELRLDVDGRYPQMVASGTLYAQLQARVHWIAELTATGRNTFGGPITYIDGNAAQLPYTRVSITVARALLPTLRRATVTFRGPGRPDRVRTFAFAGSAFHPVELEIDTVEGTTAVTSIDTGAHPNRPASLPVEDLSIEAVYRRAGFAVTTSGASAVPMTAAGADARWSDMEMHDAMQVHWSRFANTSQWALWALFAGQHVAVPSQGITPTNLGGIMFDSIGPNHRQGTAIFNESFIATAPAGDPNPAASVARIKFWTAVHEIGHTFNLAHAWQKALGTPWIPLDNEPEARSFMNYPYRVQGGESAFFADFEYRFSDDELVFMRHAPARFVQQGNADWFDDHAFEGANELPYSQLAVQLRVHRRNGARFEFLEPVVLEVKLTNVSQRPCVVDANQLAHTDDMVVIIKRRGGAARQWTPFARYCIDTEPRVLAPRESMYGSLPISVGTNGWDIAEPGSYEVQVLLRHGEEDVVSDPLTIRVDPPASREDEHVAQDVLTDEIGRALAFGGTRAMGGAVDTLQEVTVRLPERRIATHAQLALGNALAQRYKLLDPGDGRRGARIVLADAAPAEARARLDVALHESPQTAADTLGHIDYTQRVVDGAAFLAREGADSEAAAALGEAKAVLADRGVLPRVVAEVAADEARYAGAGGRPQPASRRRAKAS